MTTNISEMGANDADDVRLFNGALKKEGVTFQFPEDPSGLMPKQTGVDAPHQIAYILRGGSSVHGAYILKHELAFCAGESFPIANYQLPLSRGVIDRRYAMVGVQLVRDALTRQPCLYSLGMGNVARPLPRLLAKLGWTVLKVPFLFRIHNAANFAKEIRWLRQRRSLRMALDLARHTRILEMVLRMDSIRHRSRRSRAKEGVCVAEVHELPEEINAVFARLQGGYGLMCDRRAAAMRARLPSTDPKLSRLLVERGGKVEGWIVFSTSQLRDHTQFGDMKVGCIVDGLASVRDVDLLVSDACRRLVGAGCDLLVTNQTHPLWIRSLGRHGFYRGPSNFILAMSPSLAVRRSASMTLHFNRGDGDGPINL